MNSKRYAIFLLITLGFLQTKASTSAQTFEQAGEFLLPGEYLATDANREPTFVDWNTATQNLGA